MSTRQIYKHPPVVEATIEIGFKPTEQKSLDDFKPILGLLNNEYEKKSDQFLTSFEIDMDPAQGGVQKPVRKTTGYLIHHKKENQYFIAGLERFTFSRLHPYKNWEHFSTETKRIWKHFKKIACAENITSISLRYLNRIKLPKEITRLNEHLNTFPGLPHDLGFPISKYLMKLELVPDQSCTLTFTNALESEGTAPNQTPVAVLDYKLESQPKADKKVTEESLWEQVEHLHILENKAFESCITEATRKLFQ